MKYQLATIFLLISSCVSLFAADPVLPPPPSATSSPNHKAAYAAAVYFRDETQLLRTRVVELERLLAQQGPSLPTEITQAITQTRDDVRLMLGDVPAPINVVATASSGIVTISWGYPTPAPDNLTAFRIQMSGAAGDTWGSVAMAGELERSVVLPKTGPGTYLYRVLAVTNSYAWAKESAASVPASAIIAP